MTVEDLLNRIAPFVDLDDPDAAEETMNEAFERIGSPQMTGGADWSAFSVWALNRKALEALHLRPRNPRLEIFLVWPDGYLDDSLVLLARIEDPRLGGYRMRDIRDLNMADVRRLELDGLLRRPRGR